ncbi:MAG: lysophospholipid acyltransferase family protein [Phycisphaerales bacterium]
MAWALWIIAGLLVIAAGTLALLSTHPSPSETFWSNVIYAVGTGYVRVLHRLKVRGREHIPPARDAGPLIVVANHTAGVDPILVSAACPFQIRWIMAEDMRLPWLGWFWRWQSVIFVSRSGRDRGSVRTALEHLNKGGVIGIFPEGGLERPSRQVLPFRRGVGLLINKAAVPVLPVFIDGTPQVDPAWASLWHPSRSTIEFGPSIDYASTGFGPGEIADDLHRRYLAWSGWPANDHPRQTLAEVTDDERADDHAAVEHPA